MVKSALTEKPRPATGPKGGTKPAESVTYTFDDRTFIVRPVFKDNAACTVSDALLRLMRADLEQS